MSEEVQTEVNSLGSHGTGEQPAAGGVCLSESVIDRECGLYSDITLVPVTSCPSPSDSPESRAVQGCTRSHIADGDKTVTEGT